MANDYFDFLNQNAQQEKPAQEEPKEESVNLTTRADAECTVMCDGDFLELLAANQVAKIKAPVGQHFLQFISTEHPDIVIEKVVDFPVAGKNHVVLINEFQALISAKINKAKQEDAAAEAKAQAEAEAARKKANADAIESIQKLIEPNPDGCGGLVLSGKISDLFGALELLRKTAELGYAPAQYLLGVLFDYGGKGSERHFPRSAGCAEREVEWLQNAAKQGLAPAEDPTEAAKWYRKAAEQGLIDAQVDLAFMYLYGEGAPYDMTEALKWFRKAAEQGDVQAQLNLGFFYEHGDGVQKDKTEAAKWYRMAAEQGNEWAKTCLKRIGG